MDFNQSCSKLETFGDHYVNTKTPRITKYYNRLKNNELYHGA